MNTSMDEEEEVAPDQATTQRALSLRERSSRDRTWGRRPERVDWSVSIKLSGNETKQLSMPPTTLTSNSIDYPDPKDQPQPNSEEEEIKEEDRIC